jgi:hypothetical protein
MQLHYIILLRDRFLTKAITIILKKVNNEKGYIIIILKKKV